MFGLIMHLDEYTLLRYTANDLAEDEFSFARSHLAACGECGSTLAELKLLGEDLRRLAAAGALSNSEQEAFGPDDPFQQETPDARKKNSSGFVNGLESAALAASEGALPLRDQILASLGRPGPVGAVLSDLSLQLAIHRLALLYALQEAGRQSAGNPIRVLEFARETIDWLRRQPKSKSGSDPSERMVPRLLLSAHAHMLFAIGCLWTKEFSRARAHLIVAYRSFSHGGGGETSLALVELAEAQRRALAHEGASALSLAHRARETFEREGLEDYAARAMVAEGLAHCALDRHEEAVRSYRQALPIFEKHGLWSNYVGALNSAATSLTRLGSFDEARREYARGLRRFSHEQHRYWLGYLRIGLAEVLFAARRFSEAAISAGRAAVVFTDCTLRAQSLIALLLEVECWARHGSLDRARHRLELFWNEVDRDGALDPVVVRELAEALSGVNPDYEKLSSLREHIGGLIQRRYAS